MYKAIFMLYKMKNVIIMMMLLASFLTFSQSSIFLPGRNFHYVVEYSHESQTVKDTIKIVATGGPWNTDSQKQSELIITYNLEGLDTSFFSNIPSIGWVTADTTGVVDNQNVCWFHPPRHNQYRLLELAPFPRVEYPLRVGKTYARILFIGNGWGDISNSKIRWDYEVIEKKAKNGMYQKSYSSRKSSENKSTGIYF